MIVCPNIKDIILKIDWCNIQNVAPNALYVKNPTLTNAILKNNSVKVIEHLDDCIDEKDGKLIVRDGCEHSCNRQSTETFSLDGVDRSLIYGVNANANIGGHLPIGVLNDQISKYYDNKIRDNLLYINFTPRTKLRLDIYDAKKAFSYATIDRCDVCNTDKYYATISMSKFCLSPYGNCYDCYRTWESIYLGCVPIVQRDRMTECWSKELPMLLFDSIDELTQEYLEKKYKEINTQTHDYRMATKLYWIERIRCPVK